jgi:hypothetical protein
MRVGIADKPGGLTIDGQRTLPSLLLANTEQNTLCIMRLANSGICIRMAYTRPIK